MRIRKKQRNESNAANGWNMSESWVQNVQVQSWVQMPRSQKQQHYQDFIAFKPRVFIFEIGTKKWWRNMSPKSILTTEIVSTSIIQFQSNSISMLPSMNQRLQHPKRIRFVSTRWIEKNRDLMDCATQINEEGDIRVFTSKTNICSGERWIGEDEDATENHLNHVNVDLIFLIWFPSSSSQTLCYHALLFVSAMNCYEKLRVCSEVEMMMNRENMSFWENENEIVFEEWILRERWNCELMKNCSEWRIMKISLFEVAGWMLK